MPAWALPAFVAAAAVSLVASGLLVRSLEALGTSLGMPQALLGLAAALAADGPELTSAIAAQAQGQHAVGVGVLFGSNVFNIAALLGLGTVVAGSVRLHRRVVLLEGATALAVAVAALALVTRAMAPWPALGLALALFVPYVTVSAALRRFPLPPRAKAWLEEAVREETEEVTQALPPEVVRPRRSQRANAGLLALSCAVVIGASALMEHAATVSGSALHIPQVVTGGVVLAAVTSLPNAVAAVYLARAGRGAAVLSEAMNSNTINVVGGLLIPAVLGSVAFGRTSVGDVLPGAFYLGLSLAGLVLAYAGNGLSRLPGASLIAGYIGFLAALVAVS